MADAALERLDAFPYRHRVSEVMIAPLVAADSGMTLEAASLLMVDKKVSSLIVMDDQDRAKGILTERDILRALARHGAGAANDRIEAFMATPVHEIRADAFIYRALGRMMRLGVRHLVAVEPASRRAVGMVTSRALLKLRVGATLQLGDALHEAENAADMAAVRAELPGLVSDMLEEGVGALNAAAVISQVYCDMTRRATELAVAGMKAEGKGDAPAPWAMLVLGSGGRGESLLAPDQDNAIVHDGSEADDGWFEEVGRRVSDILDVAGIPYCKGKVMASNAEWRRSLAGWEEQVLAWLRSMETEPLLMVHIFYDFMPVYGDFELAERLRAMAVDMGSRAMLFLRRLAEQIDDHRAPIGFFGGFQTKEGRVDMKLGGLLPITCGARVMALRLASRATSTGERLNAVCEAGLLAEEDAANLRGLQQIVTRVMLEQQIADIDAGIAPSSRIDPKRLPRHRRRRLKEALKELEGLPSMTRDVLSSDRASG